MCILEFIITDLALSEQSIASITLSSPKLLARVLEMHPPNAIITNNSYLPHVHKASQDAHQHNHVLIVVDWLPRPVEIPIHSWNDVESHGKVPQAPKNAPRMSLHFYAPIVLISVQRPVAHTPSHSSRLHQVRCGVCSSRTRTSLRA
jgi:hypothetical protein